EGTFPPHCAPRSSKVTKSRLRPERGSRVHSVHGEQHPLITLGGRRFLLTCAVVAAGVLLALGFSQPFMRLDKLVYLGFGAHEHSLLSAVNALLRSGQYVLGGLILAFGLLLPLLRLLYPLLLAALPAGEVGRSAAQLRALAW